MAATDGEERVIATAQHIVRTLGTNENMTEDMLRILSNFDYRFSSMNEKFGKTNLSPARSPVNQIQNDLDYLEDMVMKWDMATSEAARSCMIWECQPEESSSYLEAVDEIQNLINVLSMSQGDKQLLDRAQNIHQLAMERLEEEFRHILVVHSDPVDPDWLHDSASGISSDGPFEDGTDVASQSSGDDERAEDIPVAQPVNDISATFDLIPLDRTMHLHDIAKCMVRGGYGRECCQVYVSIRRPVLEQTMFRLGVEKHYIEDVQKMAWEKLEGKMKLWIQSVKISVKVLFASERKLTDRIFTGLGPWREIGFAEIAKGPMMQLLSFSQAIALSKTTRSPEKMFRILDMYEILWDLVPDFNYVFSDEICSSIRSDVNEILMQLGETARCIFTEFENAIQRDVSRTPVPGGAIHPLTRYVMNYIRFLVDYADTLKLLLGERRKGTPRLLGMERESAISYTGEEQSSADSLSPLGAQIVWLTVLLECNLDGKSKLYKDPAQTYLFLMNNVRYIVQKVTQSELETLLGEDWVRKHTGQVQQYAASYVKAAWTKIFACLREEGLSGSQSFSSSPLKVVLKERFRNFNSAFEVVHRVQSTWVVPDPRLREELRIIIAEKLIPAYRSFLFHYRNHVEIGRQAEKYVKYSAEDLENHLMDLFEGPSGSAAS